MLNASRLSGALTLAVRQLSRTPAFSAVVVVIIALGIGVNTAIFSVARAVMLRPIPMTEPERLVRLRENFASGANETQLNLAPLTWQRWRESNTVFTDIGVATGATFTLTGQGDAEYVPAAIVSHNFFDVLGVKPALGRDFVEEEDKPGAPRVVLLSHSFWQRSLGGDPDVLGRQIILDGEKRTVVGVMPTDFRHPYRAQVWAIKRGRADDPRPPYEVVGVAGDVHAVTDSTDGDVPGSWYVPYSQNPNMLSNNVTFIVHTSLGPETLQPQIRAELGRVDPAIAAYDFNTVERLVEDSRIEDRFGLILVSLFGALGLLLSAVGLYGLLAFQVARRTREFGVRTALGAGVSDTMGLVMKQAGILVGFGLVAGLTGAAFLSRILESQLHQVRALEPVSFIGAAAVLIVAAALASGLPALRAARVEPMVALRED